MVHIQAHDREGSDRDSHALCKGSAGFPRADTADVELQFAHSSRARNYRVRVAGTSPRDALLLSMFPHMHLRGSGFEYQVLGTHGRVDTLQKVNNYNFYWQLSYRLKTPLLLRAGTNLLWTAYFDNSAR
jgi:hypothetical protein